MSIEAMRQALEFFDDLHEVGVLGAADGEPIRTALRTAIAEAESVKPIAWANINKHGDITHTNNKRMPWSKTPLYTTPPAAQRQPLTDEEIDELVRKNFGFITAWQGPFVRAIEAAHGIKGEA